MGLPGLVVPVSGPYTATWNGYPLGTQNDDGFVLTGQYTGQEVNQSDAYGMTLVEAIWRGLNWRLRFRGLEWKKAGILASMQVMGSSGAASTTFTPVLQNIGARMTSFAQALVMTSILGGIPNDPPQTLTALNAIVAPQSNVEYLFTSKVREAPFEMVLMPYSAVVTSNNITATSFTTT